MFYFLNSTYMNRDDISHDIPEVRPVDWEDFHSIIHVAILFSLLMGLIVFNAFFDWGEFFKGACRNEFWKAVHPRACARANRKKKK